MSLKTKKMKTRKYILIILLINLVAINSKADSSSLRNKYVLKNSQTVGVYLYGGVGFWYGGGEKPKMDTWGLGELVSYERFIFNQFSLSIGLSQYYGKQLGGKFRMQLITVPFTVYYYPKLFKNKINFNLCLVNGYQKYTFDQDYRNFQNFQTNVNIGFGVLIVPKKLFRKPNKHWIFDINFGYPIYNFTNYPELGSGGLGVKYYLGK
jgi:hypothetical protein